MEQGIINKLNKLRPMSVDNVKSNLQAPEGAIFQSSVYITLRHILGELFPPVSDDFFVSFLVSDY